MLMPMRMVALVQQHCSIGDKHDGNRIFFTGGTLFWYHCQIDEPTFIRGIDLPEHLIQHYTAVQDSSVYASLQGTSVPVFNVTVFDNYLIVPGWDYTTVDSDTCRVVALVNTDRTAEQAYDFPLSVMYRKLHSDELWSLPVGKFVKKFTPDHAYAWQDITTLLTTYVHAPTTVKHHRYS